jgi:hypothetical protein
MSFWSEASPLVKGVVVLGSVALLYLGIAYVANMAPFAVPEATTQQRGLRP